MIDEHIDVAIIGGGPAGLTAALYAARARANTVVFERGVTGGQIITTDHVENYPGFPGGLAGAELGDLMTKQARSSGGASHLRLGRFDSRRGPRLRHHRRWRGLPRPQRHPGHRRRPEEARDPGEAEYTGRGVSWCATCDGALYRDKVVSVVGGGDAAVEEAIFLTKFAKEVHLIHRRDELRATKCIQERCFANPKVTVHWNRIPVEVLGDGTRSLGFGSSPLPTSPRRHSISTASSSSWASTRCPSSS